MIVEVSKLIQRIYDGITPCLTFSMPPPGIWGISINGARNTGRNPCRTEKVLIAPDTRTQENFGKQSNSCQNKSNENGEDVGL